MIRSLLSSGVDTKCRTIDKLDIFGDGSCKALYRLDGNANDESGNYHGTETNVTYGGGVYERGAVFNGSSSKIVCSSKVMDNKTELSISLWVKNIGNSNYLGIISEGGNAARAGYVLAVFPDNTTIDFWRSNGSTYVFNNHPYNFGLGDYWTHIAIAVTQTELKYYKNGTLVYTASITNTSNVSGYNNTTFMFDGQYNRYMSGSIDQVRIFNRSVTAQEVATLYAECEPTSIVDNINPFEDGSLKALYKFDNDATDATGAHNGVATNVTYASGKFGNCMVGTVSNYIDTLSNFSFMTGTNAFSWSVWIKRNDSATTEQNIFTQLQAVGGAYSHGLELYNNTIRVLFNNSSVYTISAPTDTTIWHHIAVSKIGSIMSIYLDGKPTQFTSVVSLTLYSPTWMIGRGNSSYGFNGSIDQLRIFNKALTPLEVASLYNETTPMEEPMSVQVDPFKDGSGKALYRLEGNALDESGNYNGTATSVTYVSGRFGRCFVGNNVSSQIKVAGDFDSADWAISGWGKLNATTPSADKYLFSPNGGSGWYSILNPAGTTNLIWAMGASLRTITNGLNDTNWHHYAMSLNGTTASLYKDSVLIDSITQAVTRTDSGLTIGANRNVNSTESWNGLIEQVRIFNKALTQSEVTALYNEI